MLQNEDNFHDDVKLVMIYAFLTRLMLKNLQRSSFGKGHFETLMRAAYSWYSINRQKEDLFTKTLPAINDFVSQQLRPGQEFESELVNSLAEISTYLITHQDSAVVHDTVVAITSRSFLKGLLKSAWNGRDNGFEDFDTWYQARYPADTKPAEGA